MVEATMESPSTILPDELMIEILFRVESSNPFQLRCVCKLWNSLILDPQFMKKHVGRLLTEIKDLHNKAKEHYIAFQSQIVGNNPIMPQEQVDGDDHEDEDEDEEAAEEEGDEGEEGNEQVDGDDHEDEDEDEEAAEEEGDEGEEGNEQVDGDDHEDEDDYDKDEDEEAAEEEVDEAEKGNNNEEGKEEDAEEEDKEKKLLMNIVAQLDVVLGNVVGQLNILDTIKVSQLDDMLVKTIRANLLAQLDRVKCLKSFLEVYLESPTSSFSSSQL